VAVLLLSGCTSVEIKRVDADRHPLTAVCIKQNPRVVISEFLGVVEDGFRRHGIETEVFEGDPPLHCEYVLTYAAIQGSDLLISFLTHAELRLQQGDEIVGTATYDHSGGFAVNKFRSTASKMNPVVDALLAGFPGPR
jgi:hypothetical protein